jgi:hypothetical protein
VKERVHLFLRDKIQNFREKRSEYAITPARTIERRIGWLVIVGWIVDEGACGDAARDGVSGR